MSDDPQSRRPFGERDEEEKQLPFGSHPRPTGATPRQEPPARPSSPVDPLLGGEDDPSGLSWETLLSDVDTAAEPSEPPSRPRYREEERAEPAAPPQREQQEKPLQRLGRLGRGLHLPDQSFLKRRPRSQEIATASYVEDLADELAAEEEEPIERPQVVIRFSVVLGSMGTIVLVAVILATLFTWWTPSAFLPAGAANQLAIAQATQERQQMITRTAPDQTIGIVSGHRGLHPSTGQPDPGAVCADGLTEQQVNENVSKQVVALLQREGYQVDLLDEFDARLQGYRALAVVSIHSDSCQFVNEQATGFKVASFAYSTVPQVDAQLVTCLNDRYAAATGMPLHPSITNDMTNYHNFQELAPGTAGAVIEIGFLYLDRGLLTGRSDAIAYGIYDGILCFLRNELPSGEVTATPSTASTATPVP
jgi:N-acetylmuramoyl-L-alanine amidase